MGIKRRLACLNSEVSVVSELQTIVYVRFLSSYC